MRKCDVYDAYCAYFENKWSDIVVDANRFGVNVALAFSGLESRRVYWVNLSQAYGDAYTVNTVFDDRDAAQTAVYDDTRDKNLSYRVANRSLSTLIYRCRDRKCCFQLVIRRQQNGKWCVAKCTKHSCPSGFHSTWKHYRGSPEALIESLPPTYCGYVRDHFDALVLVHACETNVLQPLQTAPSMAERYALAKSGNVIIIKQSLGKNTWRDNLSWGKICLKSPFEIRYHGTNERPQRETENMTLSWEHFENMPGSWLMRKACSIEMNGNKYRLIAYCAKNGISSLTRPSEDGNFETLRKTMCSRCPEAFGSEEEQRYVK